MPEPRKKSRRSPLLEIGAAVALALLLTFALVVLQRNATRSANQPQQMMTLDPAVAANLTALPDATPLSGEAAQRWNDIRAAVNACDEYSPQRHEQMNQHLDWLIDPSDMPPEVIIGLGTNPQAQLIYGMAAYTSTEWRQQGRPADSCLRDIGLRLNALLVEVGREPFTIFESAS
jgi:hypothetical protein